MWFKSNHHQSVGNSISFLIGPEIPNFGVFIAFPSMKIQGWAQFHVNVLINGEAKRAYYLDNIEFSGDMCDHLWFICASCGFYYESRPSGVNRIEVVCEVELPNDSTDDITDDSTDDSTDDITDDITDFIKWMGVHVECICCCPRSPIRKRRRV